MNTFDHLSRWADTVTHRLSRQDRELLDNAGHLARLDAEAEATARRLDDRVDLLTRMFDSLAERFLTLETAFDGMVADLAILRQFLDSLSAPTTYRVVINAEWSTSAMAFQIADDDHSKVASIEVDDALGLAVDPGSVTIVAEFSSSDETVALVDATTGAITPASPPKRGTFQVQAAVTDSTNGTVLTGTPADCEIIPGPASTFKVVVA